MSQTPPHPLWNRLVKVLRIEIGGIEDSDIKLHSTFADDFLADSLELLNLMMALEREFGVEIKPEEMEQLTTIKKTLDFLQSRMS